MQPSTLHRDAARPATAALTHGASWTALRERLDRWVANRKTAGLQYLVMQGGEVAFEHCAGVAEAAHGRPVCSETLFNLYSLTKPLTATLVARLALQGVIDLDGPIARATGLGPLMRFGTVRETLLHRGGFANPMPPRMGALRLVTRTSAIWRWAARWSAPRAWAFARRFSST